MARASETDPWLSETAIDRDLGVAPGTLRRAVERGEVRAVGGIKGEPRRYSRADALRLAGILK